MNKEKLTEFILDIFAVPGFAIQFINNVPNGWKISLCIVSIVCFFILTALLFERKVISRKSLIKKGKKTLNNTNEKAVLFGGDLTWKEDYVENISLLLKGSKSVEIILPKEKIETNNSSARKELYKRIDALKELGAEVYTTDTDFHMRGFIIDPNSVNLTTYMLFAKRIETNPNNQEKNKYSFEELNSGKDKEMYAIIYNLYSQIKQTATLI
ncbi:MAG: hypothetical protein J1E81_04445 [Eubacterium sp.]|nr:hypothetical protein [Eubacterium sp.]